MRRLSLFLLLSLAPACTDEASAPDDEFLCSRELQMLGHVPRPGPIQPLIGHCVSSEIDLDVETAGYQTDCVASLYRRLDDGTMDFMQPLPACDPSLAADEPCLRPFLDGADECQLDAARYEVHLGYVVSPFPLFLDLRCRLACEAGASY